MITFVPGSFRDRGSRVATHEDQIFRCLDDQAWKDWQAISNTPFFRDASARGHLVPTTEVAADQRTRLPPPLPDSAGLLRHERVPFVSYPYEWPFALLKRAALLHLALMERALRDDVILKDASPYNVQFRGVEPVFIDIGSLVPLPPGSPWIAYRQFCELFLFPLMLQAYRGIPFQPILRGSLEGISVGEFSRWLSLRDLFRRGVFSHVVLHSLLTRSVRPSERSVTSDLGRSGFDRSLIEKNVARLTRLVEGLNWSPRASAWLDYDQTSPMVARDSEAKTARVTEVAAARRRTLAWDLGCNLGRYSRILARHTDHVVALDSDAACAQRLANDLAAEKVTNILPLVCNMANPSPAQGWGGRERTTLEDRGRPDLVLCLGLIHHLVISANIPLDQVVAWLARLGGELVIEFPTKNDPMVRSLLRNKPDQYADYELEAFEAELERSFRIERKECLPSQERFLFHGIPRSDGGGGGGGGGK